ncbi:MAG: hypothetical protein JRN35_10075 [Nitrososphaerota archaeon]|nr:hypothetical protein [Nitrososphaerota archaeon]
MVKPLLLARAAFENGERKLKAAETLLSANQFTEALEPATIAAEEFGKAAVHIFEHYTIASLDPRMKGKAWHVERGALRCHRCKHILFMYTFGGLPLLLGTSGTDGTPELKSEVVSRALRMLGPGMKEKVDKSLKENPSLLENAVRLFRRAAVMQGRKERSQYVGESGGRVTGPKDVTTGSRGESTLRRYEPHPGTISCQPVSSRVHA